MGNGGQTMILGLDLGIASVGWALVKQDDQDRPAAIIACGVRHFEEGVLNIGQGDDEESRGAGRRMARGQRRNLERRARKLNKVYRLLESAGMLPPLDVPVEVRRVLRVRNKGSAAQRRQAEDAIKKARHEALLDLDYGKQDESGRRPGRQDQGNPRCLVARYPTPNIERFLPYFLRAEALRRPLSLDELGRALFQLAQRKGAWWNRKDAAAEADNSADKQEVEPAPDARATEKKDKKEDRGIVKDSLRRLGGKLVDFGERKGLGREATLGEYLHAVLSKDPDAIALEREYRRYEAGQCSSRDAFERKLRLANLISAGSSTDGLPDDDKKLAEALKKGKAWQKFLKAIEEADSQSDPSDWPARNRRNAADRFTSRSMFKREFNLIWERQLELHRTDPNGNLAVLRAMESKISIPSRKEKKDKKGRVIKPARERLERPLRDELFRVIFLQRKLKNTSDLIGSCELENGLNRRVEYDSSGNKAYTNTHKRQRAPLAHPLASRFRMLQMVNNTCVLQKTATGYQPKEFAGTGSESPEELERLRQGFLPHDLRFRLTKKLAVQGTLSWNAAREELGLAADTAFNWELQKKIKQKKGGKSGKDKEVSPESAHKEFLRDRTTARLAAIFGSERWEQMGPTPGKSGMTQAEEVFWDWYACQDERALAFIGATRWKLSGLAIENNGSKTPMTTEQVAECARLVEAAAKERKSKPGKLVVSGLQRAEQRFGKIGFIKDSPADRFGKLALPTGYSRLSTVALKRILNHPHWGMMRGHPYPTAKDRLYAAPEEGLKPGIIPQLKPVKAVFPSLNNPVVLRTLTETRLVVNEIITRLLGGTLPDVIRVEMARSLAANREQREQIQLRIGVNRTANDSAAAMLGYSKDERWKVDKGLRQKVQLAQECGWQCAYCGTCFSMRELDNMEIEHIIPRALLPDDSFANLTLAHQRCNAVKGKRTPVEARPFFEAQGWNWASILGRVSRFRRTEEYAAIEKCWPASDCIGQVNPGNEHKKDSSTDKGAHPKTRLFTLEGEALEKHIKNFTQADLQHTRYITKVAAGYLATLYGMPADKPHEKAEATPGGDKKQRIQVINGQITAILRDGLGEWGTRCKIKKDKRTGEERVVDWWISCNHVLDDGGVREPDQKGNPLAVERRKKKREDHRHNAVDAVLVALVNPHKIRDQLAEAAQKSEASGWRGDYKWGTVQKAVLPDWPNFYQDLRAAIHETDHFNCGVRGVVVSHRVQSGVTGSLHDETFRSPKQAVEVRPGLWRIKGEGKDRSVTVIRVGDGIRERLVKPGENHHVEVFQTADEDWKAQVVSFFDLAQRLRRGHAIVASRLSHDPSAHLRCYLHKGNMLQLSDGSFRVVAAFSTEIKDKGQQRVRIKHLHHADARIQKEIPATDRPEDDLGPLFGKQAARKVIVTPLGEVRPVND
jgi:CRISPR/Cas system Type II protein with McrA/HNH and RuvC-like nuclease domain